MKAVFAFVLVAALALVQVAFSAPAGEDKPEYTSKFDSINLDEVLGSDRLLRNYHDCLMDRKPCTAEGSELKARIPEALKTDCAKCTNKQREGSEKAIRYLMKNKPEMWAELVAKYDPEGAYTSKYADRLNPTPAGAK